MRKLLLKMSVSVDGFVAGPNGEIDWLFKSSSPDSVAWLVDMLGQVGAHLMGSRTFHDMAAFWPTSTQPIAAPMNAIPKVVFTRKGLVTAQHGGQTTTALRDATRQAQADGEALAAAPSNPASWANPQVASGDLAEEIARLKAQPGKDLLAHGGAGFARSLVAANLIDEYRLVVHPVALGRGLPLFSTLRQPLHLTLLSSKAFEGGAVANIYGRG